MAVAAVAVVVANIFRCDNFYITIRCMNTFTYVLNNV